MITAAVLDAMVASGCTPEQIAAAVKAACASAAPVERECSVYRLVDPRSGNRTFYVGIATDPARRLNNHANDPSSAAYPIVCAIRAAGFDLAEIMQIETVCSSRADALELEAELLGMMPDLVNRARPNR